MSNKLFFGFVIFILCSFKPASGIYDITLQTIGGPQVNLGTYAGKKIIVLEFDPVNYDASQLLTLDTIQRTNAQVQVIAVPAKDFGPANLTAIQTVIQNLNLSFIVTKAGYVKKSAGANQQNLFNWLTHVNENTHFDNDADDPGQIFIVNGEGVLYAMLDKGTPNSVVKELANQ